MMMMIIIIIIIIIITIININTTVITLCSMSISDRKQSSLGINSIEHGRTFTNSPVIDVATKMPWGHRRHSIDLGRCYAHDPKMRSERYFNS